ncbi:MAG: HEAT repeat domain-containing protein [Sedimentisphaerales bacterium]
MSWLGALFGTKRETKGSAGKTSGMSSLIAELQSGDEKARAEAAVRLSRLHEQPSAQVVQALSKALSDESQDVRNNAAESLRVMIVRGYRKIDPTPLIEALKREPKRVALRSCLRELGLEHKIEEIMQQQFPDAPKYTVPCMPFGCPKCGMQITRVPSWPMRGNSVPFYAQVDLNQSGAYHIEFVCPACKKQVFVVWDSDPR